MSRLRFLRAAIWMAVDCGRKKERGKEWGPRDREGRQSRRLERAQQQQHPNFAGGAGT